MAQNEYNTNRKYRHLTREKRAQIEVLLQLKLPKSHIAREVGIARSTLYIVLVLLGMNDFNMDAGLFKHRKIIRKGIAIHFNVVLLLQDSDQVRSGESMVGIRMIDQVLV